MASVEEYSLEDQRARLEDLLARLTRAVGRPAERWSIREAIAEAECATPDAPDAGYRRLLHAARLLNVRLTPRSESVHELIPMLDRGAPIIGWVEPSESWLLLIDREGHRVRLMSPDVDRDDRWVHESEVTQGGSRTGQGRETMARWLLAQPLGPKEVPPTGGQGGHGGHGGHGGDGPHGPPPLRRLVGMLRLESRDIWMVVVFAVGVGILSLATPITVDELITSVKGGIQMRPQVLVLALILLFCLALAGGMRALSTYVVELIQQRFFVRVVGDLAYRLPRVRLRAFDRQNGPELVNRFFDVLTVQKAGAVLLLDGVSVVIQAVVGLIVLGFYHPFLLGFDIVLLGAVGFIVFVLGRGAVQTSIAESLAKYGVAGWLEEMVRQPQTFKHGGAQDYAMERADALATVYLKARQRHFAILFRQVWFSLGLQAVASAALLGIGGWLVIPDETGRSALDVGQLVAAEVIVVVIVGSLVKLGKSLESYYDLLAAVDKLGHLVDLPLERNTGEGHYAVGPASLRLRRLTYQYEENHGQPILHDLNADIPAGARLAVVGPSGSGKSTLLELIYGLREPSHGGIELDGVDARDIRLETLREQVALVGSLEIFVGTLIDNVRMGRLNASLGEIRKVLDQVGLLEDIQAFPEGLHTVMNITGKPFSLGQVRRLLLARSLLGNPRVLLLDESLDDIDEQSHQAIMDVVLDPDAPWTVLVVTHREDVIARCTDRLELNKSIEENSDPSDH